jgi:hypothetical protein
MTSFNLDLHSPAFRGFKSKHAGLETAGIKAGAKATGEALKDASKASGNTFKEAWTATKDATSEFLKGQMGLLSGSRVDDAAGAAKNLIEANKGHVGAIKQLKLEIKAAKNAKDTKLVSALEKKIADKNSLINSNSSAESMKKYKSEKLKTLAARISYPAGAGVALGGTAAAGAGTHAFATRNKK